jgi:sarcosine oxidase, subunit gamma
MRDTVSLVTRRSPLGDAPSTTSIEVRNCFRLAPAPPSARFTLRLRAGSLADVPRDTGIALDIPINRCVTTGSRSSTRLGPDEWLLRAPLGEAELLAAAIAATLGDIPHARIDIGHRHTALHLEGPKAADMLNAGCPLDLAAKTFPTGAATRTLLGKAEIILWRWSDAPAYEIECGRSFAPYVWEFLVEAGREYR